MNWTQRTPDSDGLYLVHLPQFGPRGMTTTAVVTHIDIDADEECPAKRLYSAEQPHCSWSIGMYQGQAWWFGPLPDLPTGQPATLALVARDGAYVAPREPGR